MKHYKPYSTKLKRQHVETLHSTINKLLVECPAQTDDDKLLYCVLRTIQHRLYVKLDTIHDAYRISFKPEEAFALRILSTDYVTDKKSYTGNRLLAIANEVHQHYS